MSILISQKAKDKGLAVGLVIGYSIAGLAGLIYQIISFKLLAVSGIGSAMSIAITLTVFVAFSGIGAFFSRYLTIQKGAYLEVLVAVYGLSLFGIIKVAGVLEFVSSIHSIPLILAEVVLFILITPFAVFTGILIPLYHRRHKTLNNTDSGFNKVYFGYHLAGGVALIFFEFFFFPVVGWVTAGLIISLLLLVSFLINAKSVVNAKENKEEYAKNVGVYQLLALSVLSGYAGVLAYQYFKSVTGNNVGIYSITTVAIFLGLGVSALMVRKAERIKNSSMIIPVIGVALMPLAFIVAITVIEYIKLFDYVNYYSIIAVLAFISILIPFVLIGVSIPLFVKKGMEPGLALLISSVGNAFGYWVYILSSGHLPALVTLYIMAALLMVCIKDLKAIAIVVACAIFCFTLIPENLTLNQYLLVDKYSNLRKGIIKSFSHEDVIEKKYLVNYSKTNLGVSINEITEDLVTNKKTRSFSNLFVNSTSTVVPDSQGEFIRAEAFVSLAPAVFLKNKNRALVLGAGTGVTAGYAASIFKNTTVVDISPNTKENLAEYEEYNMRVLEKITLKQENAISMLFNTEKLAEDEKFQAIIGTITGTGVADSAMFYTKEFFSLVKNSLSKKGIFSFWMDAHTGRGYKSILAAVACEFEHIKVMNVRPHGEKEDLINGSIKDYVLIMASNSDFDSRYIDKYIADRINMSDTGITGNNIDETMHMLYKNHALASTNNVCADDVASVETISFAYDYEGILEASIKNYRKFMSENKNN